MTATQHRFAPPDMDRDPDAGRPREFDYGARCDELRCRTTKWLRSRRQELVKERRRLYVEVLAVLCVLDERDAAESASPGESPRLRERDRKTANNLKDEPDLAKAAHDGEVSEEQLSPASDLADSESDAEWAQRARNMSPGDLRNLANRKRKLTNDDARARREARDGRMWWRRDDGMLDARFSAPDLDGALIETVFRHLTDRMKPAKGERWDTLGHRNLDALVELCRNYAEAEPTGKLLHTLLVEVPLEGPATINGIPLPDDMIEALRAQARVEPFLVDDEGVPLANGKARTAIPPKIRRAVMLRDGHCRWPGCERRTGLDAHHLTPRSWGGTDDLANLAAACTGGGTDHHAQLVPHGDWWLLGNPNQPDGLKLIHRDDPEAPRAGPSP